jgi:hypothetical protein
MHDSNLGFITLEDWEEIMRDALENEEEIKKSKEVREDVDPDDTSYQYGFPK